MASDSAVLAGTSRIDRHRLTRGSPPTNCQRYASKLPTSSCTSSTAFAFAIVDATLSRLRTIPGSASSFSLRASP